MNINLVTVIFSLALSISLSILVVGGPASDLQAYAQSGNDTSTASTGIMTNGTAPVAEKLTVTPGEKTFHIFTSEIENVDEEKLGVAGDSFSMNSMVVKKGDKVNVNFYNVDDVQTEKHTFTIDDPYAVNIDLAFAQNGNATFTADQEGVFTFYCAYHLPVMSGQFEVVP
jgi:nitrous oxide reductase